ncbi:MAG: heavy-metal-associated domain-containing protein [Actinobacteria bacterium]|nr:heavy-metal-associated domain-containing protein [Actinomycetota bacterium]
MFVERRRLQTKTYTVPGMHCGHCEQAVKTELGAVPGVQSVQVELDDQLVTVQGEQLDDGALRAAIDEAGYQVTG